MTNISAPLVVSPALSPEILRYCEAMPCDSLVEGIFGVPPYCRLQLLRLCGKSLKSGGCGIPTQMEVVEVAVPGQQPVTVGV